LIPTSGQPLVSSDTHAIVSDAPNNDIRVFDIGMNLLFTKTLTSTDKEVGITNNYAYAYDNASHELHIYDLVGNNILTILNTDFIGIIGFSDSIVTVMTNTTCEVYSADGIFQTSFNVPFLDTVESNVAITNNHIYITDPLATVDAIVEVGEVHYFDYSGVEVGILKAAISVHYSRLGQSIASRGNIVAVGSPYTTEGKIIVWDNNVFIFEHLQTSVAYRHFPQSIAINQNYIVGVNYHSAGEGSILLFSHDGTLKLTIQMSDFPDLASLDGNKRIGIFNNDDLTISGSTGVIFLGAKYTQQFAVSNDTSVNKDLFTVSNDINGVFTDHLFNVSMDILKTSRKIFFSISHQKSLGLMRKKFNIAHSLESDKHSVIIKRVNQ